MKTGADISHHQASFNAADYKAAGEDFIILKATEGSGFTDNTFKVRWNAAEAVKLPRIAYHFARPGIGSARDQADHFIDVIKSAGFGKGCSWALDLEDAGGRSATILVSWAEQWIARVRPALPSKGLFYSYIPFIKTQMGNLGRVPGDCMAWVARYRTDNPYALPIGRPAGFPDPPEVWQCGDGVSGCVKSVATIGKCDYNRMTDAAFTALFVPPAPPEENDMYDAAAEKRLMDYIDKRGDQYSRESARWTDHGDNTVSGASNHLLAVRGEVTAVGERVEQNFNELNAEVVSITNALKGLTDAVTTLAQNFPGPVPTPTAPTVGFDGEIKES